MRKIYYILFNKDNDEMYEDELPESFEIACGSIFDEGDLEYIIMDVVGHSEIMIIAADDYKFAKYIDLLRNYDYLDSYEDITFKVVMGDFVSDCFDVLCEDYPDKINKMIYASSDVDMILDKISLNGIDSLTDIDKLILNEKG